MGDLVSISGSGRPPRVGNGTPLQYSCLEKSMGRGTWQGYSPWGYKELYTADKHSFSISVILP